MKISIRPFSKTQFTVIYSESLGIGGNKTVGFDNKYIVPGPPRKMSPRTPRILGYPDSQGGAIIPYRWQRGPQRWPRCNSPMCLRHTIIDLLSLPDLKVDLAKNWFGAKLREENYFITSSQWLSCFKLKFHSFLKNIHFLNLFFPEINSFLKFIHSLNTFILIIQSFQKFITFLKFIHFQKFINSHVVSVKY